MSIQITNEQIEEIKRFVELTPRQIADGTTGTMADINFAFNSIYSDFTTDLTLTDEQNQLINLKGMGSLRDLRLQSP